VIAELLERNWLVGGENSGHIVCFNHTTTGDAIIAALQVLMALRRDESLAQARQALRKCPQVLINVRFGGGESPLEHPAVKEASARVTRQWRVVVACFCASPAQSRWCVSWSKARMKPRFAATPKNWQNW
jgi:phosphomannomutase